MIHSDSELEVLEPDVMIRITKNVNVLTSYLIEHIWRGISNEGSQSIFLRIFFIQKKSNGFTK